MVKSIPEFSIFTVFLKNRNIISKIWRSKVTDKAALVSFYRLVKLGIKPQTPGLQGKQFSHTKRAPNSLIWVHTVYNIG